MAGTCNPSYLEAGELLEPGRQRLQWAEIAPPDSSLVIEWDSNSKKQKKTNRRFFLSFLLYFPPSLLPSFDKVSLFRLECSAEIRAHCNLQQLHLSDPPDSAFQVAMTTGMYHHSRLILKIFLVMGSCYVAQADPELLAWSDPPTLASQSAFSFFAIFV